MAEEEKEETTTEEQTTDVEEPEVSLDEILSGDEPAEEPEPEVEPEPEAESEPEGDKPVDGEDLSDEQVAALPKNDQGFYKGMKEERGKRQGAEGERDTAQKELGDTKLLLQQATELLQNLQTQAPPAAEKTEPVEPADFWGNPEAYIAQALEGVTGKISEGSAQAQKDRLTLFENAATQRHTDFAEVNKLFIDTLLSHPDKAQAEQVRLSIVNSADPGEAAYQYGLKLRSQAEMAEAGGMDALVAKKVAEKLAEAQEQVEVDETDELVASATLPKPMSNRRSTGGAAKPLSGYESDQSLSGILEGR